jgi:CubicO group peptidase (beta-lactamase class C family)
MKNRIAAAILLAFSCAAMAQTQTPPLTTAAVDTAIAPAYLSEDVERTMKLFDVPGIAIAIVKDGQVVAARGFGVRKLGSPDKVDGKTLFEVASNSKAFTAAALAMLVDEGKLAWDDPVTKHLPDFQMYDAYVTHEMTVRDLLTHRSGLGLGAGDLLWWPTTNFSTDEIIHKLRFIAPSTSFRSSYAYDNLLYIVAGKIIAAKSGKTWGETIHERILAPVGMTHHHHQPGREREQPERRQRAQQDRRQDRGREGDAGAERGRRGRHQYQCRGHRALDERAAGPGQPGQGRRRQGDAPVQRQAGARDVDRADADAHLANRTRSWPAPVRTSPPTASASSCATGRAACWPCTAARCRASIRRWCWCRKKSSGRHPHQCRKAAARSTRCNTSWSTA